MVAGASYVFVLEATAGNGGGAATPPVYANGPPASGARPAPENAGDSSVPRTRARFQRGRRPRLESPRRGSLVGNMT